MRIPWYICLAAAVLVPPAARADDMSVVSRWVELGPGGTAEARVAVRGDVCPAIVIDGKTSPMRLRAARDADFDITLCSAKLPADAKSAGVPGQPLPLPAAHPSRILVI